MRRKERVNFESGVIYERVLWATLGFLIVTVGLILLVGGC
ncbi:hypothetical protein ES708_11061 [subsurface metagenome]